MKGIVSVNQDILPTEDASPILFDKGFLYGDAVFEVIVAFQNDIMDLDPHLSRLEWSCEQLGINFPWSREELKFEVEELNRQFQHPKKYIRIVITRGFGVGLEYENPSPNKYIYVLPAQIGPETLYAEGISLKKRRADSLKRGHAPKTSDYLRSILAINDAKRAGFDDVLWTNSAGEVTEASTANIFFIGREGDYVEIATPSTQSGILEGITRNLIIELLEGAKIPVQQRIIFADEIPRFDEAFLTSTVKGLVPIRLIDQHKLHTNRPSSVFKQVQEVFLKTVWVKTGRKVDWRTGNTLSSDS